MKQNCGCRMSKLYCWLALILGAYNRCVFRSITRFPFPKSASSSKLNRLSIRYISTYTRNAPTQLEICVFCQSDIGRLMLSRGWIECDYGNASLTLGGWWCLPCELPVVTIILCPLWDLLRMNGKGATEMKEERTHELNLNVCVGG